MRLLVLLVALGVQTTAHGQLRSFKSSEDLLTACKVGIRVMEGDATAYVGDSGICIGYINGYLDGIAAGPLANRVFCIPSEVTMGQLARVIVKFLSDHPNALHLERQVGIMAAL